LLKEMRRLLELVLHRQNIAEPGENRCIAWLTANGLTELGFLLGQLVILRTVK
jgi:hypothetical protein